MCFRGGNLVSAMIRRCRHTRKIITVYYLLETVQFVNRDFPCNWKRKTKQCMRKRDLSMKRTGITRIILQSSDQCFSHSHWNDLVSHSQSHWNRCVWTIYGLGNEIFKKRFPISFLETLSNPQLLMNRYPKQLKFLQSKEQLLLESFI